MTFPRISLILLLLAVVARPTAAQEQRPSAMKLFPSESVVFVRAADIADLRARFRQSALGRMISDPQVAPLVGDLVNTAKTKFDEEAAEEAGFDSSDLDKLPTGEAAFALVDIGATEPIVMVLLDFGDNRDLAPELLEKLLAKAQSDGATVVTETMGSDELTVIRPGDNADQSFGYIMRNGCMFGSNDQALLAQAVARWDALSSGGPPPAAILDEENPDAKPIGEKSLAENERFVSILRECSTQLSEPPQALFYVDPIQLMRIAGRESGGLRVFLAMMPALGIDGFQGLGGTLSLSTPEWDSLVHVHLLLENPRVGVINLIRFREVDHTPPTCLPASIENYDSTAVDPTWLFEEIAKLYDNFRYDGAFREASQEASDAMGKDIETEILPLLTGRLTTATAYPSEDSFAKGQQRLLVVEFNDADDAKALMEHFENEFPDALREDEFGGVTYWGFGPSQEDVERMREQNFDFGDEEANRRFERQRRRNSQFFSIPTPAAAVIGNSIVVATSHDLIKQCIEAEQGTIERLADDIEYRLIASRISRMTRGRQLSLLQIQRPAKTLGYWYDFLAGGTVGEMLTESEDDTALEFGDVLSQHELPEFEELARYLGPSGGFLLDTDSGFHYMAFSMRREAEAQSNE